MDLNSTKEGTVHETLNGLKSKTFSFNLYRGINREFRHWMAVIKIKNSSIVRFLIFFDKMVPVYFFPND